MIRVGKMEASCILALFLPGFSFRVSASLSTRESINHSRHAIPSACSAIVDGLINPINPSSVSSSSDVNKSQRHR
jgi:hypothetical protein